MVENSYMAFAIENKRRKLESLKKLYPDSLIVDVTSKGDQPWVKFSPFYPHRNIPVPLSVNCVAASVESIWQGLKVFESADIDTTKFAITNLKGLKRTVRKYGRCLGHRAGVKGLQLLSYREARLQIYLPAYRWVLDNCLQQELAQLAEKIREQAIILLDYETNDDIENLTKPLSHASLIIKYINGQYPAPAPNFP
jgi:hypothetical protein